MKWPKKKNYREFATGESKGEVNCQKLSQNLGNAVYLCKWNTLFVCPSEKFPRQREFLRNSSRMPTEISTLKICMFSSFFYVYVYRLSWARFQAHAPSKFMTILKQNFDLICNLVTRVFVHLPPPPTRSGNERPWIDPI